ncbi:MAG: tryptophan synthase subunit alpha [Spirochaetia bacterium]
MAERACIMAHLVAFNPSRDASREVARGLAEGGCAYLEMQFPFSDPTADGPDIQRACGTALSAGFTVSEGFRLVGEIAASVAVPVFVMSYANPVFTRGVKRFVSECRACGVKGLIVPDLPLGYDEGLFDLASEAGIAAVPVVSPSISAERLEAIARLCPAYLYATLRIGTTGSRDGAGSAVLSFLSRIAALNGSSRMRVLGGFGVSTAAQVQQVQALVHAVVVGSALVREIEHAKDPRAAVREKMKELTGG